MAKIKSTSNGTKKEAIIRKAAALFRTKGFKAASMRELAVKIGVEAPSLYNHIGSKSEMLQAICFKVAHEFTDHLAAIEQTDTSIATKIRHLIQFHIKLMLQDYDEVFVSNHEWKHLEDPHLTNFLQQRKAYEGRMVNLVKEGVASGEFKELHPHVVVLTILSALRGLEFWQRHKKDISTEVLAADMVDQLLNGLTK